MIKKTIFGLLTVLLVLSFVSAGELLGPDLAVTDASINLESPGIGSNVEITGFVENLGNDAASMSYSVEVEGPSHGGGGGGCCTTLSPGESQEVSFGFVPIEEGEHIVTVSASTGEGLDTNPENNEYVFSFNVKGVIDLCPADVVFDDVVDNRDIKLVTSLFGMTSEQLENMGEPDANSDKKFDVDDIVELILNYGEEDELMDINNDGIIDGKDVEIAKAFTELANEDGSLSIKNPDVNKDGIIDIDDIVYITLNAGACEKDQDLALVEEHDEKILVTDLTVLSLDEPEQETLDEVTTENAEEETSEDEEENKEEVLVEEVIEELSNNEVLVEQENSVEKEENTVVVAQNTAESKNIFVRILESLSSLFN